MTKAIAIDLGGSHASIAIVDERSLLAVKDIAVKATDGLAPLLPHIRETVRELLSVCSLPAKDCLGVSLSLPSLVDFRACRILSANDKYSDAPTLDLPDWCSSAFGLPLALENDARASLMGEHHHGAARGASDVLMLTFGTGIGSAVLVDGKPYRTKQAQGGNLGGHIPVMLNGRECTCGAVGCMEAEASTWALPLIVSEWPGIAVSPLATKEDIGFKVLFDYVRAGDACAQKIAEYCTHIWATGIVGLIHSYGPELVVLGGGVMQNADVIVPAIQKYVDRYAWTPSGEVKILPAKLGNQAALYAAIPLLRDALQMGSREI